MADAETGASATKKSAPKRAIITGDSRPVLPRHVKMRHDAGRGRWLILAPERVFDPDDTAVAVLKLCDGQRSVNDIANVLSQEYQAPSEEIKTDIIAMLQDLSDKGVVQV